MLVGSRLLIRGILAWCGVGVVNCIFMSDGMALDTV